MSFIYYYLEKINQSELSFLLFITVYCFIFFKNLNHYAKIVYQKHLSFLELLYQKKEKVPIDFLIDVTDVDSYFFHNFLDVFIVQNRVTRISQGLLRKTY